MKEEFCEKWQGGDIQIVTVLISLVFQLLNTPKSLREDDISSMEFLNTVPHLCPNLKKVTLGHRQGDRPHSLCTNDVYSDEDRLVSPQRSNI